MMEDKMPGTKRDFYFTYLKHRDAPVADAQGVSVCKQCGSPAYFDVCSVCRLKAEMSEESKVESQKSEQ